MKFYPRYVFFTALLLLWRGNISLGQLSLTGSNGCNCNGEVAYTWAGGPTITAELTDFGNQFVQSSSASSGVIHFQNLCPRVYSLLISGLASEDTTFYFNIEDVISPLPNFSNEVVCYSDAGQDEIMELADIAGVVGNSYQWNVPGNYLAVNGNLNADEMSSGLYTYTDPTSSCLKSSGLNIEFYYNSAGSETGSLLICESEVDSINLITLLGGNPATGGYWTFQGEIFNGVFYPATMEGGFSNRYYYNVFVPECGITDVAPATVIERVPPNPGFSLNSLNFFCQNETTINMFDLLGGNPQRGGDWTLSAADSNSMVTGIDSLFIPGQSPEGVYEYGLIPLLPCVGTYKSSVSISYYPDPSPGINLDTNICSSSDTLNILSAIGAPTEYSGSLTDISGVAVNSLFIPSEQSSATLVYSINPFGCGAKTANIQIVTHPDVNAGPDQTIHLCSSQLPLTTNSILDASADTEGIWYLPNGVVYNGDIEIGAPIQNLLYVKSNDGCGSDTSMYHTQIDLPINFTPNSTSIALCPNDNPVNLLSELGSPNLIFTNALGDTLPIVIYPDSSSSGVIYAHLNSGNSCPNIEFPVNIELYPNAFMVDFFEYFICESQMPLPLSDLVPLEHANAGLWLNESNTPVSFAQTQANDIESFTFELSNPPLCGSSNIEILIHSEAITEGPENTSTVVCQSNDMIELNSLIGGTFIGSWWLGDVPVNNTVLMASTPMNEQFEYRISSANSCPDATSYHQVEVRALPVVDAGEDVGICMGGDTITFGANTQMGYTYSWSPSTFLQNGNVAQATLISPHNGGGQVILYALEVQDEFCSNVDSIVVTIHELPYLDYVDSINVCHGQAITIEPNTNGTLHWISTPVIGDSISSAQTIVAEENQTIQFTSISDFGCSVIDSTHLNVNFSPRFALNAEPMGSCSPLTIFESIDTCNQADANFQWLIPGGDTLFGRNITATISAPGVHDLIIQAFSSEGCVSDTLISDVYEVYGNPTADFVGYEENASNLRQEIRFTNVSSNAAHFEWSIDGTAIDQSVHLEYDFEAMAPGTYNICLLAKSVEGCENFTCHNIDLIVEQVVFAPSAFTPNNDGTNDGFKPVINGFSPEIYEFIVADRWGNIIFKSTNPDEYWMGEVDNGDYYSQNGVYNWMLKAKKFDTVEFEVYRGSVIMIR